MNERTVIEPQTQHGKPVIRGTRVPAARILAEVSAGIARQEWRHLSPGQAGGSP